MTASPPALPSSRPRRLWGLLVVTWLAGATAARAGGPAAATGSRTHPPPGEMERCVVVASTNDIHGAIEPSALTVGSHSVRYGGLLALSGYVSTLRQQFGDRLLLVDGGDMYQGTLASNLSHGRAIIEAMGLLGYDAAAVGNHEFDFGGGPDRLGVVKQRIAEAPFPFLAVNIFDQRTARPVQWANLKSGIVVDKGGVKVGLLGASTPETPRVTRPQNVQSLRFPEPAALVAQQARALRARGADLVVLVAHMGSTCDNVDDPHDASSCAMDDELTALIAALPEGTLDVAVGGHTHALMAHWVNGVAAIEAGSHARKIALVKACASPGGGLDRARSAIYTPSDICWDAWIDDNTCTWRASATDVGPARFLGAPVAPQAAVVTAMQPYLRTVAREKQKSVGVYLPASLRRDAPEPARHLGLLVAQSLRRAAAADFGLQNLGGVRADLTAGALTFGQIFEALPFDNQVARLRLTGTQLLAFVTHMAERRRGELPYLAGLRASRDQHGAVQLHTSAGAVVEASTTYTLGTNDFLAMGGEGLAALLEQLDPDTGVQVLGLDMREALIGQLRAGFPGRPTTAAAQ